VTRKISLAAARAALGDKTTLELRNVGASADWSAARDIVAGLHGMAEALAPRDLILASGRGRSILDVLDVAYSSVDCTWTDYVHAAADQAAPYLIGNIERAARYLGWRPQIEFERMIHEMVQADLTRLRASAAADLTAVEGH
jgi:GDPmannose 4,6-dehydratase